MTVTSVSNTNGTLTISPTTGDVVASLAPAYYPVGFVNKFRNPSMNIAQRGTTGNATTIGGTNFTLD